MEFNTGTVLLAMLLGLLIATVLFEVVVPILNFIEEKMYKALESYLFGDDKDE